MLILIWWEPMKAIRKWWNARLRARIPLTPGYGHLPIDSKTFRAIRARRRKCSLTGHLFQLIEFETNGGFEIYHLECARCSPHVDSRLSVPSRGLFAVRKDDD